MILYFEIVIKEKYHKYRSAVLKTMINKNQFVFVFLLVLLIYLIIANKDGSNLTKALLGVAAGAMFIFGWKLYQASLVDETKTGTSGNAEYMSDEDLVIAPHRPGLVDGDTNVADADLLGDIELSQYGNESNDFGVNVLGQTSTKNVEVRDGISGIDNGDVFDAVFGRNASMIPLEVYSDNYNNVKDREWYTKFFQQPENIVTERNGSIPLNEGGINADSALTRRQIFRGDMNKKAIDGAVRATRTLNERVYTHELAENYAREWVSDQGDGVLSGTEVEWT
jgi:hypothetical protein